MKKQRFKRKTEKLRKTFFLFGLVVALGTSYSALSYNTALYLDYPDLSGEVELLIEEDALITIREMEKPKPKKQKEVRKAVAAINLDIFISVDDFAKIEESNEEPMTEVYEGEEDADVEVYFTMLDRKPVFSGCENLETEEERFKCFKSSLRNHIADNFVHNQNGWGGNEKIMIHFIIDKEGKIQKVQAARGDESDRIQLEKLIKELPPFVPAMYNGKYVKTSYVLPVVLRN